MLCQLKKIAGMCHVITRDSNSFKRPPTTSATSGLYRGSGLPTKYGTKQKDSPQKSSQFKLPRGVPPLKFN